VAPPSTQREWHDRLYLVAGYAYLDGEVVRVPRARGRREDRECAEHSANVWANHRDSRFDLGLGARYVGEQFAQSVINGRMVPSYNVDAMGRYVRCRARWRSKSTSRI
jgi:outer membrane receptor for monomeric catechols